MTIPVLPRTPSMIYPVKRTNEVQGTSLQAWSGRKTWLPNWPWPIYHYEIGFSSLHADASGARAGEYQALTGFWNIVQTQAGGYFSFRDPEDETATLQVFGVGDGTTRTFQLVRTYGGFVEPVRSINAISQVRVNGSATGAYTTAAGGLITFTVAPPNGQSLDWTGTFYWLCQFDQTTADFENFAYQLHTISKLTFQTALP